MINNEEILKELMDWFDKEYPGVHNEVRHSKCLRDTGYNLTAILRDLSIGGISETCKVSKKYWQGAASQLGKGEREYAVAVNNKLGDILVKSFPEQKEKVIRLISNINDITTFGASSDLMDAMKFRENIRFFKQDEYPTKMAIQALIRDAHELVPQKNNIVECNIAVYGPEHAKEKEKFCLSTMCGVSKEHWRKGGEHENDYVLLKKIYDNWRIKQMRPRVMSDNTLPYPDMQFNEQVRAPYLLVYTQRLRRPTENQKKRGFPESVYKFSISDDTSLNWYISAAMHGVSLNYLAADRGINGSFCKCFHYNKNNATDILAPAKKGAKSIAFMIGLGYRDTSGFYPKETNYSQMDEYIQWK